MSDLEKPSTAKAAMTSEEMWELARELQNDDLGRKFKGVNTLYMAIKFCVDSDLNPVISLNKMRRGNKGGVVIQEDVALAIAFKSGLIEDIDEFFLVNDPRFGQIRRCVENRNVMLAPIAAVFRAKRRGFATWHEQTFSLADAKQAKLITYAEDGTFNARQMSNTWCEYTARMLQHRARGFGLRSLFNDTQEGIQTEETDYIGIDYSDGSEQQVPASAMKVKHEETV